jgi:hypothetical protein
MDALQRLLAEVKANYEAKYGDTVEVALSRDGSTVCCETPDHVTSGGIRGCVMYYLDENGDVLSHWAI